MFWLVLVVLAVAAVLVIARDLTRGPLRQEPSDGDPVRELLYGHHAREAQGWTLQPPGGHSGGGL